MYLGLKIKICANNIWNFGNAYTITLITLQEKIFSLNNFYLSKFEGLSNLEIIRYLLENKKDFNAFN